MTNFVKPFSEPNPIPTSTYLSPSALKRIVGAPNLPLADAAKSAQAELEGVLEQLAHRALHREAFNGPVLSVGDDLEKLLRVWKRMHSARRAVREKAKTEMRQLVCNAADKGASGPIPPPFEHPNVFETWLTDVALANGVEWELMAKCLDSSVFAAAEDKALRVAETMTTAGLRRSRRRSLDGGAPANHERDLRTVKLLAVFWLFFAKEPNGAIAEKRPMRRGGDLVRSDQWRTAAAPVDSSGVSRKNWIVSSRVAP